MWANKRRAKTSAYGMGGSISTKLGRFRMGLLPDTKICELHMCRECRERFAANLDEQSRHSSRHVRDVLAVMHVGITN